MALTIGCAYDPPMQEAREAVPAAGENDPWNGYEAGSCPGSLGTTPVPVQIELCGSVKMEILSGYGAKRGEAGIPTPAHPVESPACRSMSFGLLRDSCTAFSCCNCVLCRGLSARQFFHHRARAGFRHNVARLISSPRVRTSAGWWCPFPDSPQREAQDDSASSKSSYRTGSRTNRFSRRQNETLAAKLWPDCDVIPTAAPMPVHFGAVASGTADRLIDSAHESTGAARPWYNIAVMARNPTPGTSAVKGLLRRSTWDRRCSRGLNHRCAETTPTDFWLASAFLSHCRPDAQPLSVLSGSFDYVTAARRRQKRLVLPTIPSATSMLQKISDFPPFATYVWSCTISEPSRALFNHCILIYISPGFALGQHLPQCGAHVGDITVMCAVSASPATSGPLPGGQSFQPSAADPRDPTVGRISPLIQHPTAAYNLAPRTPRSELEESVPADRSG
ncbi:hypothetical protein C8R43DRAFT_940339 [Mycena crocata]|nr:hypothetical protein C8R43DRAFT_940339 [Mycena crocata]